MESGILAKALYTNTPEAKNELFFRKGDILTVIQFDYESQVGWWLCTLRGEKGLCPGNYLELLKEDKYAPIYGNELEKEDDLQQTYDVPRSHNAIVETTVSLPPDLFYDIPPSAKSFDTRSNTSVSHCGGSEISLMSSGTLSHYSSSSSSTSPSIRSSEICDVTIGNNQQSNIDGGNIFLMSERPTLAAFGSKTSISVRSSGISCETDGGDDNWYDVPRPATYTNSNNTTNMNETRFSKSSSSVLTDDSNTNSISDLYDIPKSIDDGRPSSRVDSLGLTGIVQLRNKTNSTSVSNRRAQFVLNKGGENSCTIINNSSTTTTCLNENKLSFGSPLSKSIDICDDMKHEHNPSIKNKSSSISTLGGYIKNRGTSSICSSLDTISISSGRNSDICKPQGGRRERGNSIINTISSAASQESIIGGGADIKTLPLTPNAAISVCEKMRQEVMTGINSILIFVQPKWRSKNNLEEIMPDLRFGCVRLNLAIRDFTEFCSRSVSNARKIGNDILIAKLRRLLTPISTSSQMIQQNVDELEAYFWSSDRLSMIESEENTASDALNHLVLCSRNLSHHVTEIVNFLALNSTALFREEEIPVEVPVEIVDDISPDDGDYDYVVLNNNKPRPLPPPHQNIISKLNSKDIQLLEFYSEHISTIGPLLSQSISTFISSIQQNEPPKVFNGHLKYVILLAYKLLFAGDTVHRNIINNEIKIEVETKADELHKSVVELHNMSKIASKEFPKILPMERIIDHVWQTTAAASQLKKVIFSATCI